MTLTRTRERPVLEEEGMGTLEMEMEKQKVVGQRVTKGGELLLLRTNGQYKFQNA